jgi:uncharacterized protein involved in response to NO
MKKISGKIAMVLILVILISSFTGCLSYWGRGHAPIKRVLYAVVDILTLPISLLCLLIYIIVTQETETQSYLANLDNSAFMECYSLYEKMHSLPEAELASLTQTLNSISETERNYTIKIINSLPETTLVSLAAAYKSLPESDIISSIERIKSLPETELVSLLQTFNSLTEAELNSLIESINTKSGNENVVFADNFDSFDALEVKPVTLVSASQY